MRFRLLAPMTTLTDFIDVRHQGMLYAGIVRDWAGGDTHVEVHRQGDLRVFSEEHELMVEMPVAVSVEIRKNDPAILKMMRQVSGIDQLRFSLTASFAVSAEWTDGWELSVRVRPDFTWIEKPRIGSLLSVQIGNWLGPAIRRQLEKTATEVGQSIEEGMNLRELLPAIWQDIHRPVIINQEWPVWLNLETGKQIQRTGLKMTEEGPELWLEADVSARLIPGPEPGVDMPGLPEPAEMSPANDSRTTLPFHAEIPLAWLSARLEGYRMGMMTIRKLSLEAEAEGLKALAEIRLGGKVIGVNRRMEAVLEFRPQPAPEYVRMSMHSVDLPFPFSLTSSSWQTKIEGAVSGWLQEKVAEYEGELQDSFRHLPLGDFWALEATGISADLRDIRILADAVRVSGAVQGEVRLRLVKL